MKFFSSHTGRTLRAAILSGASLVALATAAEAGLCEKTKNIRSLSYPRISDHALGYFLYLLREVKYEGNLKENPFFLSVGLDGDQ